MTTFNQRQQINQQNSEEKRTEEHFNSNKPTFQHHCVLIQVEMDKYVRRNTFIVNLEQVVHLVIG